MSISIVIPPKWCADAVLSKFGWVNEKTGEIYVRIKGIKDSDIEAFNKARYPEVTEVSEVIVPDDIVETQETPEVETADLPADIVVETKQPRKRKSTKSEQE